MQVLVWPGDYSIDYITDVYFRHYISFVGSYFKITLTNYAFSMYNDRQTITF